MIVSVLINLINFQNIMPKPNDLEKKLYQLIIARLDGNKIKTRQYRERIMRLAENNIGGFIIFGGIKDEIKLFITKLQSISEIPLFIAADIERGVGQQIIGTTNFPCQMAIASAINKNRREDIFLLDDAIKAISKEAVDVGINMPLIPVIDVNKNPDNPIICTRAFSDNPKKVAWFGSHYIRIIEGSGLISCPKHFPGHGDTAVDSHISLPVITKSKDNLMKTDIMPFIKSIKAGASSMMIGHLKVPALDSKPASLSKKIIADLLKKELGFKGLVITDALNMSALKDFSNVHAECINAGVDMLLHPLDVDATVKELVSAIKSKYVKENRINDALYNIIKAKERLKKIRKYDYAVDYEKHILISEKISDSSIAIIKGSLETLNPQKLKDFQIIFAGDKRIYQSSMLKDHFMPEGRIPKNELIIISIFTSVAAWRGSSGIDENEKNRINNLTKRSKRSIVVSFGSPYILRHFKDADILIAAYEPSEQAQRAFLRCLKGESEFKGRLPVKIY